MTPRSSAAAIRVWTDRQLQEAPASGIAPLVSSRRWEAFRQGIREYRALADCAIGGTADVDKAEACRLLEHAIDAELEGLECR